MEKTPKVSIIIPVFNDENFIVETLQSLENQIFTEWECIIVNDGSQDNSEKVILKFIENKPRFSYRLKLNSGVSATRNFAIGLSKGIFILPLDSDDKIGPEYLKDALLVFKNNPETNLVYCKAQFFGNRNDKFGLPKYNYSDLLLSNMIFCSALFKKADFERTSGYDINLISGLEDWEFWIRFLNEKSKVVCLNKTHFYYRIKDASRNSVHEDKQKLSKIHDYIFEKHKSKYNLLFFDNLPKIESLYRAKKNEKENDLFKKSFFYKFYKIERELKKLFLKK